MVPQDRKIKGESINWKNWMSVLSPTTCTECAKKHGTIFPFNVDEKAHIPLHLNGKCRIVPIIIIECRNAKSVSTSRAYRLLHDSF